MERKRLQRGLRKLLGVMDLFIILIVELFPDAKPYQVLPIKYIWHLYLYVSYSSGDILKNTSLL